ncbi:MAG TPA: alpha/beta hydrolase [Gemmatimonadaceae bacterium]|nr:alpha/beta hydrolase [Gemmatimonadaceae bacterium]
MLAALPVAARLAAPLGAQRPNTQEGYVVTQDSMRLFYRVVGSGPDTIIAIHGGPGVNMESIAADFAPLAARHTVIFYDQRGTGRSTLPRDTTKLGAAQQIADLEAVRAHFGVERVALVAHSYGPLLAATYALEHPEHVSRMVFFGPVPPRRADLWQRVGRAFTARLDSAQRARLADANRRLADSSADIEQACRDYWAIALRPRLADPDRSLPLIRSEFCTSNPAGIRYGLTVTNRVVMASYGDWDLRDRLRTLRVPTLIVYGEADAIPEDLVLEWVSTLPHAAFLPVPGAAHFAYAERPDFVWPRVERFLSGARP